MDYAIMTMDYGPWFWTTYQGLRTRDYKLNTTEYGLGTMDYGLRTGDKAFPS